jgi:hypothetical protein
MLRLELNLKIETTGGIMSHWSSSAAQRFLEARRAKQLRDSKVLHDSEMLERKASSVWLELSEDFRRKCEEFNKEPGVGQVLFFDNSDPHELKIRCSEANKVLTITFINDLKVVRIKGLKESADFNFGVLEGTSNVGLFYAGREPRATDDIATAAMDMFLAEQYTK